MNRVKEVERINARDLQQQLRADTTGNAQKWDINRSWHAQYKDSAYVYAGGLPNDLSEGDLIVVFSQFGEIVDINLPRDKETGNPRGFAFIAYEDQRSTVLAVDNMNGAKLLGRTLRVDHCASFHEEQKKDPAQLPDHVVRKLSEAELEQKQRDIEQRNRELDEASAAKSDLFAIGRGTESERERDEREIRQELKRSKEAEAAERRASHIASVLARRKGESQKAAAEEARQKELREQRKRQREHEELERRSLQAATAARKAGEPPPPSSKDAGLPAVSASKWDRLFGASKKKKHKDKHRDLADEDNDAPRVKERGSGEGISVEETNQLRASLGLKPLRS
jgi:RNA-binding motif X-linked protein 2